MVFLAGGSSDNAAASESLAPGSPPAQGSAPQGPAAGAAPTQGSAPAQDPPPAQSTSGTGANPPAASAGTITINWAPPTENTDGTTLENLAGYKIHYGTASKKYTQTIKVSNPGLATYVISSLSPGTYYFSMTAYNAAGTESSFSSEVSEKVN